MQEKQPMQVSLWVPFILMCEVMEIYSSKCACMCVCVCSCPSQRWMRRDAGRRRKQSRTHQDRWPAIGHAPIQLVCIIQFYLNSKLLHSEGWASNWTAFYFVWHWVRGCSKHRWWMERERGDGKIVSNMFIVFREVRGRCEAGE